jgi:uncharacterized membrane protein (Fun14 family)
VAIDNIAAAASPLLTSIGFSGLIGFLIGFAVKKVMKILAVGAGLFFAGLMYLESQNIVNINWDKLQTASQNAVSILTNAQDNSRLPPPLQQHHPRILHFQ